MSLVSDQKSVFHDQDVSDIDIRQFLAKYLSFWYLFLLSIGLCLTLSFLYIKYTTPIYNIAARLLIDENKGGGLGGSSNSLVNLEGIVGGKSSVDNEAEILQTNDLIERVIKDLQLNITYYKSGLFRNVEIYKTPFIVQLLDIDGNGLPLELKLDIKPGNKLTLSTGDLEIEGYYDTVFAIPDVGKVKIVRNPLVSNETGLYLFKLESIPSKIAQLTASLNISVENKLVSIIDINLTSPIPEKGEDILNRLIYNYVQENLRSKNEVADSTIAFIKRRLLVIGSELNIAEQDIQGFKQKNSLADMTEQGRLLVNTNAQYLDELSKAETQISIIKSLIEYLKDDDNRVVPSTLLPTDMIFTNIIEKYNSLLLERARILIGLTPTNPVVINLDKQIASAKLDVEANLSSTLQGLLITRSKIEKQMAGAEGLIQKVPEVERNYLQLARQQQIKQELYVFLMQKSEETAISKTANLANSRLVDYPRSSALPVTPKRNNVLAIAFVFGLILPIVYIYTKDLLNNKVENKEDITSRTNVSILGEISEFKGGSNLPVASNPRLAISEQFRALRTNLSFYLNQPDQKTILLTSSMSGEGKSFISINLGLILALSGKRVVVLEMDLRKPRVSSSLGVENKVGITNFIVSKDLQVTDIVKSLDIHKNLFLVSSGPIPPNPAELILSERTNYLLDVLKADFDYVIIDAPPVGIITDAQLLSDYSDLCLYVIRQGYTLKSQIGIVHDLNVKGKMKQLGIIVNGIDSTKGYGYGYEYGYGYGNYGE